jgi:hypothetical protein
MRSKYSYLQMRGQACHGHGLEHRFELYADVDRQCLVSGGQYDNLQHDGEHDIVSLQVRDELHLGWHGVRGEYADAHVRGQAGYGHGLEHGFELYADVDRQCLVSGGEYDDLQCDGQFDILSLQVRDELHLERCGVCPQSEDVLLRYQARRHGMEHSIELLADMERERLDSAGQRDDAQHDTEYDLLSIQMLDQLYLEWHRLCWGGQDAYVRGQAGKYVLELGFELHAEVERRNLVARGQGAFLQRDRERS